ncbi:8a22e652-6387-4cf0-a719-485501e9d362 [Thermothielavioides terrestris]|uniref:8a22e652-6387-4cf0-a719-485501e9d362 n=1 Tax=Thermothielavioides terrestris TaxID=2587410 RepID=A0A446B5J8_9PEZI|nr:8a22e652-6387-4cf0-a719-485501e9d362 [Thermothielavioides terrestris]
MSGLAGRRPGLASSASSPDIFCRPMEPSPAPLVYINGWHGTGKKTVAECLTLLLGRDKSLLIDVRGVGRDSPSGSSRAETSRSPQYSKHGHYHDRNHNPLLTPEHPRYFSFDLDCGPDLTPSTSSRSAFISPASTTTTNDPSASAPTAENLALLLTHPRNRARLAVLPACAPDTPAGRATLRTFEAAAARAGRLFAPVALTCAPGEHARRVGFTGPAMGVGMGVGWAKGQGLAAPMNAGLTVDVTRVAAFEAALQIVEYVKGLEAEREAELCSAGGSPASTPGNSPESARAWTSLRLGGQQ